jgi:hypothetical protein
VIVAESEPLNHCVRFPGSCVSQLLQKHHGTARVVPHSELGSASLQPSFAPQRLSEPESPLDDLMSGLLTLGAGYYLVDVGITGSTRADG